MKKWERLCRNIPLMLSAGAYFVLAVPATGAGLAVGALLTVACYLFGLFIPNTWQYTKRQAGKGHWIASIAVCLLMGLRFDSVWKLSSQIGALTERLHVDTVVFLSVTGCVLAVCAVFFTTAVLTFLLKWPIHFLEDFDSTVDKRPFSNHLRVGIAVVLVLQLALLCYWGVQKQGFHVDEVYTFELSNYPETIYGDSEDAYTSWKTGDTFAQILEPAEGRLFDLSVPFWSGETDNHPSTYYILVHIFSSLFEALNIGANKWAGLIPNILCSLVATWFMIRMLRKLLQNDLLALLGGAGWAFCIGTINTVVYLRMYALLTMFAIIFSWLHLKFLSDYANGYSVCKLLVLVQLATMAGILSQYYFLFFAFFFCSFVCVYLFLKKDWAMLRCYMLTEISAVAASELLFPRMIVRLFFGDRGSEALSNMLSGGGYISKLLSVFSIINEKMFGGYGAAVIVAGVISLLISVTIRKKFRQQKFFRADAFVMLLLAVALCYILAVTKIAPYQVDRYFMCIFPLLMLCGVYGLCRGALAISAAVPRYRKLCMTAVAAALAAFTIFNISYGQVSYIYADGAARTQSLFQYEHLPVVALNGDTYNDSVLQWAFEFQNYENVFLCRNNTVSDISIAAQDGKLDNGFLLYVHQDDTDAAVMFAQITEYLPVDSYTEIANTQGCRVFYCTVSKYQMAK